MNTRLGLLFVLASLVVGCATDDDGTYEPGPDRAALSSKADTETAYSATYTCDGGTGDVSVSVEKKVKAVYVQNTEAGARYLLKSKTSTTDHLVADEKDPYTDSDLMGDTATISTGTFTGAATIHLTLNSGESGGHYTCTRDAS